ncbi:hypothetical protein WJX72_010133 [[Myrmecia] bisecta]|uniref:AB hydrolase-1 domain-containing protein n=1 Tax=[Myrmecia] bisecta TaxID=41462 RepID=A0AAW1PKU0_9CHLO
MFHSPRSCRFKGAPGVTRRTILLGASAAAVAASPPVYAAPVPPFCGVVERVPSWVFSTPWEEQLVEFHGLKTWTRSVGKQPGKGGFFGAFSGKKADSPTRLPLLCLHGGPGLPSRYLETLELLTGLDRRVVFYDQIGCGNSYFASGMRGPEQQEISPQLFMEELRAVREALDLQQVHLFGHGWGGMLALSAILDGNATGIASLTLASTPSSYKALIGDRQQLIQQLPEEQQAALRAGAPTWLRGGGQQQSWKLCVVHQNSKLLASWQTGA